MFVEEKLVELTPGRAGVGWAPEPAPDLLLDPLGIHEADVGRINLDGISDSGVEDGSHATTARGLFSNGRDHVGSVIDEWQRDASDTVDIETWVRETWNNHRKGERAGELELIFEDAI